MIRIEDDPHFRMDGKQRFDFPTATDPFVFSDGTGLAPKRRQLLRRCAAAMGLLARALSSPLAMPHGLTRHWLGCLFRRREV